MNLIKLKPMALACILCMSQVMAETAVYIDKKTIEANKEIENYQFNFHRYDKKTYKIAYDVFLMNGEPKKAYLVAKAAVKFNPQNIEWREKLAQSAMWSGFPDVALRQWLYFYDKGIKRQMYAPKILKLAGQILDYNTVAYIWEERYKRTPENKVVQLNYIKALQKRGTPNQALSLLNKIPNSRKNIDLLKQYVAIAEATSQPELLHKSLQQWQKLEPKSATPLLKQSTLFLSQGQVKQSWENLQKAQKIIKKTDAKFWRNFSWVARLVGDTKAMLKGYQALENLNALEDGEGLTFVFLLEKEGKTKKAYKYAKRFYKEFKDDNYIGIILNLGITQNQWESTYEFYQNLTKSQKNKLLKKLENKLLIADLYAHNGMKKEAYKLWEEAIAKNPNDTRAKRAVIWSAIDNRNYKLLNKLTQQWAQELYEEPELQTAYRVAHTVLGKNQKALLIALKNLSEIQKDYANLLDMADTQTQNEMNYHAYLSRKSAFALLYKDLKQKKFTNLTLKERIAWSQLMRFFASNSTSYRVMQNFQNELYESPEIYSQVLGFALEQDNLSLAKLLMENLEHKSNNVPAWMQQTIALAANDRPKLHKIIHGDTPRLPHRDVVTSARRVEEYEMAEELAYRGLEEHPTDYLMYDLFKDTTIPRANKFSTAGHFFVFNSLKGPVNITNLQYFVTPSLAFKVNNNIWFINNGNEFQITNAPKTERNTDVRIYKDIHLGFVEFILGQRQALGDNFMSGLRLQRNLNYRFIADLELLYQAKADETAPLILGGMKNAINFNLTYPYDSYNILNGAANYWWYYGQNGQFLGTGFALTATWRHYFALTYPDWNIFTYVAHRKFLTKPGNLTSPLQELVPANTPQTTAFYMPVGFNEIGLLFGLGQRYAEEYSKDWRFYLDAGFSYSDSFGLGKLASMGYGGSLFGRDKLLLYLDYSDNAQQALQSVYFVGVKYDFYF